MTAALASPAVEVALFRSAMYEALALAFAYPTLTTLERLSTLLEDLADLDVTARAEHLVEVTELREAFDGRSPVALAAAHNHLFELSSVCTPYETEYEADPFAKGRQLADIAGFYRAFGMSVSPERPNMTDHLGTELEFMALLTRKEAYAEARGWKRRRATTVDAERSFLRDHLGRWERAICREVVEHVQQDGGAEEAAYGVTARIATRWVSADVRRLGVHPLRLTQRLLGNQEPVECPFAPQVEEPPLDAEGELVGEDEG